MAERGSTPPMAKHGMAYFRPKRSSPFSFPMPFRSEKMPLPGTPVYHAGTHLNCDGEGPQCGVAISLLEPELYAREPIIIVEVVHDASE